MLDGCDIQGQTSEGWRCDHIYIHYIYIHEVYTHIYIFFCFLFFNIQLTHLHLSTAEICIHPCHKLGSFFKIRIIRLPHIDLCTISLYDHMPARLEAEGANCRRKRNPSYPSQSTPTSPHPNSRDVSGVVAYAEVLLEIHGLVGGAELEERRDTRVRAKQMFGTAGRERQRDEWGAPWRGQRLETVEKLLPLVGGKWRCANFVSRFQDKIQDQKLSKYRETFQNVNMLSGMIFN